MPDRDAVQRTDLDGDHDPERSNRHLLTGYCTMSGKWWADLFYMPALAQIYAQDMARSGRYRHLGITDLLTGTPIPLEPSPEALKEPDGVTPSAAPAGPSRT